MVDVGESSASGEGGSRVSQSRSNSDRDQRSDWFEALVRAHYWPREVVIEHITDKALQLAGIDMRVTCGGMRDHSEIKFRYPPLYPDVLLERYHESKADGSKRPGWINLPLRCNRFKYVYTPTRTMLVMSWSDLQRTYKEHRDEWCKRYRLIESDKENPGYTTHSVAVPIGDLAKLFPIFKVVGK